MDDTMFSDLMAVGRALATRRRAWPESDSLRVKRATSLLLALQAWRARMRTSLSPQEAAALQAVLAEARRFLDDHDASRSRVRTAVAFPRTAWS